MYSQHSNNEILEEFLRRQEFLWNYCYLVGSEGSEKYTEEKKFKI